MDFRIAKNGVVFKVLSSIENLRGIRVKWGWKILENLINRGLEIFENLMNRE